MLENEVQEQSVELQQALESQPEQVSQYSSVNQTQEKPLETDTSNRASSPASPQQENFRKVREKLEKAERERDEYARKIAQLSAADKPSTTVPEEDLDFNLGDNDIAEGKHLSKMGRKMKQLEQKIAEVENKRQQLAQQSEEYSIVAGIKADYPDIDKVVNEATMEALERTDPDLVALIKSSGNLRGKAVAAYKAIKDKGLYVEDTYASERERVQKNIVKPKPTAAVAGTGTPLSQADMFANGLTKELKDQLHKEMIAAMKAR